MATSRIINVNYWKDGYIVDLDPSEKLLFLYFLTNPRTTIAGVYEITLREVAFDTGFDIDMVKKILARFCRDGKMHYANGWLILKNFIKHQRVNPSVKAGIERVLHEAPKELEVRLIEEKNRGHTVYSLGFNDSLGTDSPQDATLILNLTKPNLDLIEGTNVPLGGLMESPQKADRVRSQDIDLLFDLWEQKVGYRITNNLKKQREYAAKLIRENTLSDVCRMIDGVALAAGEKYAPRIGNFRQLHQKWDDLIIWGRKESNQKFKQQTAKTYKFGASK